MARLCESYAAVPGDLEKALAASPRAARFFATLDSANRYAILFRLHTAKRPETRAKRLALYVGMLNAGKAGEPAEAAAIGAMQAYHFVMMGSPRTLWDFFLGANWFMCASAVLLVVALWQAGALARRHGASVRPLVVTLALGCAAYAGLSVVFFFAAPVVANALAALCAGAAALQLGRGETAPATALQP